MRAILIVLVAVAACSQCAPAPAPQAPAQAAQPAPAPPPKTGPFPEGQGKACRPDGTCGAGMTCLRYYGIAGTSGPQLSSCEFPCGDKGASCPEDQRCVTIADGPGRVCRPITDTLRDNPPRKQR